MHGDDRIYKALMLVSGAGLLYGLAGGDPRPALGLATLLVAAGFLVSLHRGRFTVDLLMAVVGAASLYYGLTLEGLIVLLLYGIAETVEHFIEEYAHKRILDAASLIPETVLAVRGGTLVEVEAGSLREGDTILVRVGEAVPADSTALSRGAVDLSHVTGEPEPLAVSPGDPVPSGALVTQGPLRLRVERRPGESYAQRLLAMAREALEEKPRLARLLERYTPHLTLTVLAGFAVLHQLVGPERALAVLLAGCPSAFIIASTYSTSLAMAMLAGRGALARSGEVLERLWRYDVVVLDKTGTLTSLVPVSVEAVVGGEEAVRLVASAARASRHPVARALAMLYGGPARPVEVVEVAGRGLEGEDVEIAPGPRRPCGKTVLARALGAELIVCLREEPVRGARELVGYLRSRGVRVVLASGDDPVNVERVARLLGVEEYYGGLTPEEKAGLVARLQGEGLRVVFVGDGVNDAPALARADVGIAVGSVDLARGVADAVAPYGAWQVLEILRAGGSHRLMVLSSFVVAGLVKLAAGSLGVAGLAGLPLVALLGDDGATLLGVAVATAADRLKSPRRLGA